MGVAQGHPGVHHLPPAQLAAVVDGLRRRGLVDADGGFTDAGRELKERIEAVTDELAAPAYEVPTADELDELIAPGSSRSPPRPQASEPADWVWVGSGAAWWVSTAPVMNVPPTANAPSTPSEICCSRSSWRW
jgi:hypothetical protein